MNSAQAWQIVLDRMKLANPGRIERAAAESSVERVFRFDGNSRCQTRKIAAQATAPSSWSRIETATRQS